MLILPHRNSSVNVDYFPNRTHESIDPSGTVQRIWAVSVLKFDLRWRPGRRDWWCLRWQTDTLEVSVYRGGVGDEGDNLHFSLTDGTHGDIDLKHTCEERGKRQSVFGGT